MRLPRNISAKELRERLKLFGYEESRQKGNHIRMMTYQKGEHHLTIPNHDPVRIGTFAKIINQVAEHMGLSKDEVITQLFGK